MIKLRNFNLEKIDKIKQSGYAVLLAVYVGNTRLIDNFVIQ